MKIEPWEQQPNESAKAFQAFQLYLNQGYKRSHKKVAISLGTKSFNHISAWSSRFNWVERISAWEKEKIRLELEVKKEKFREMTEKHFEQATDLRNMMKLPLQAFATKLKNDGGKSTALKDFEEMTSKELFNTIMDTVRTLDVLIKIERLSLGAPTEIINNTNEFENVSPSKYADEIANSEGANEKLTELLTQISIAQNG